MPGHPSFSLWILPVTPVHWLILIIIQTLTLVRKAALMGVSHCTCCSAMYSTGERRSGGVPVGRLPKGSPRAVFLFFFFFENSKGKKLTRWDFLHMYIIYWKSLDSWVGFIVPCQRLSCFIFNKCLFPCCRFPLFLLIRFQTPRSMYRQHYGSILPMHSYSVLSIVQLCTREHVGGCASIQLSSEGEDLTTTSQCWAASKIYFCKF